MTDATVDGLLRKLEEHEEAMASLYTAFGSLQAETADFWKRLACEEHAHAAWLRTLRDRLAVGEGLQNRRLFNSAAVQTSIDYIQRRLAQISSEGITALRALVIALDLEDSLLEKEYFCVLASDSPEMQRVFNTLSEQTREHRKQIEALTAAEKAKGRA